MRFSVNFERSFEIELIDGLLDGQNDLLVGNQTHQPTGRQWGYPIHLVRLPSAGARHFVGRTLEVRQVHALGTLAPCVRVGWKAGYRRDASHVLNHIRGGRGTMVPTA